MCIVSEKQETAEDETTFHRNQDNFTFDVMYQYFTPKPVFHSKLKQFVPRGTSQKQSCWL